ncbi:MAG: hypothetical protein KDA57_04850 [Planctomycetales bacterium]|nr:hypothetical protein [Planctomycetales bacterium]
MTRAAVNWTAFWRKNAYLRYALWLACAVLVLLLLLMPFAHWQDGSHGLLQVAAAAVTCLLPGTLALWISSRKVEPTWVLFGIVASMGLRLLPPLVICLVISLKATGADYFNFICYLLLFYFATLAFETYSSIRLLQPDR